MTQHFPLWKDKLGEFSWEGGHGLFLRTESFPLLEKGDLVSFHRRNVRVAQAFVHHNFPHVTVARVEPV